MANSDNCPSPRAGPQSRPKWKPGAYLTAAACATEQNYRLQKLRRHNREAHGWGVMCGLWVVPADDGAHPWGVQICPGYAISPYGDEIELSESAEIDVEDYLWFRPDDPFTIAVVERPAYVVVRYQDQTDDLTSPAKPPCSCTDPEYTTSRIGDGYQAGVVWTPPLDAQVITGPLCLPDALPCPPCPESPWVTLAAINLPARGVPITAAMIDNGIRNSL